MIRLTQQCCDQVNIKEKLYFLSIYQMICTKKSFDV